MQHYYEHLFQKSLENIVRGEKIISQDIENKDFNTQIFWLSTRRFISHAKSIVYLCDKKQNLEALMLLRPIIELVVNLRWVIEDTTGKNREQFVKATEYKFNNDIPRMAGYWSDESLVQRMKTIGFDQDYYNAVVKKLHEELHENPAVIARAHKKDLTLMGSESIFSIVCQFTGHLLKVANELYPNKYFLSSGDAYCNPN